jgi:hypothetical protein
LSSARTCPAFEVRTLIRSHVYRRALDQEHLLGLLLVAGLGARDELLALVGVDDEPNHEQALRMVPVGMAHLPEPRQ